MEILRLYFIIKREEEYCNWYFNDVYILPQVKSFK